VDEHINLSHAQRLEAFVRGPDRHVLRLPQMALDVCGSHSPGDESHTALCQGQKRGCAEPGPNAALMAIAASRCCQKLLTMLLRHVAGEPKVWSVVRVPSEVDEDRRQLQWQGGWPASRLVGPNPTLVSPAANSILLSR